MKMGQKKSNHIRKPIQAELVEFPCEKCNQGVYRVDQNRSFTGQQWPHVCTHCKRECYLAKPFPMIVYKEEKFILDKHVVRQQPKPI
ncbi:hypothetical protein CRN36_07365 [Vibrio vulnificus]|nr:hypothetical protein CRN36_07365 [Vibrio vulnificus]